MIFFDIDNTLLDHDHAMRRGAHRFQHQFPDTFPGPSEAFADRWISLADRAYRRYLDGRLSLDAARIWRMQTLFQSAGVTLEDRDALGMARKAIATYMENWRLFPDVRPGLASLGPLPLGIISNGDPRQQHEKLAAFKLTPVFRAIHISGEIGTAKPDPGIFKAACRLTGVPAGDCVYVGDQLAGDARAAARAGMTGIWLNRKGRPGPPSGRENIIEITTLAQLPQIIQTRAR